LGVVDKRVALRALLAPHAKDLVAKVIEMAKAGDAAALRMCLDRLIPIPKARDEPVQVPGFTDSPAECGRMVVNAIASGELTPEQGSAIMNSLTSQARIIEVDEIEQRLRKLEEAHAKTG
jgi:hypothetical protein